MELVIINELASELRMDRSRLQRYVKKLGIVPSRVRNEASRNQATLAITPEQADQVRQARMDAGFQLSDHPAKPVNSEDGYFYVVLPDPDARPNRVKVGFATSLDERLKAYATANPGVTLLDSRRCKRSWEAAWITLVTSIPGCRHVKGEVFDCDDIQPLQDRLATIGEWLKTQVTDEEGG